MENKVLSQKDLYDILPFGKTKIKQLIKSGETSTNENWQ